MKQHPLLSKVRKSILSGEGLLAILLVASLWQIGLCFGAGADLVRAVGQNDLTVTHPATQASLVRNGGMVTNNVSAEQAQPSRS